MIGKGLINIRNVISRDYSTDEVFDLLRMINGLGMIVYYMTVVIPHFNLYYSKSGLVAPEAFSFYPKSWVFLFNGNEILLTGLLIFLLALILCYTIGLYAKWALVIFLPIHLGFHTANPFIIHEPQQLSNLLLILTLLFPIENKWALKTKSDIFPALKEREKKMILFSLGCYLSLYYFFAGFKKIPDSSWLNGEAVHQLLSWPYLSRDNFFNEFFKNPKLSPLLSYFTIFFELSFFLVAITKYRKLLIPIGVMFHLIIGLSLDIGLFFWSMISWYPVLLIQLKK